MRTRNHGFHSIGSLSESLGSQRFGTSYRFRGEQSGRLDGDVLPVADGSGDVGYFTLDGMEPDTGEHLAVEEAAPAPAPARTGRSVAPQLLLIGATLIAILAAALLLF